MTFSNHIFNRVVEKKEKEILIYKLVLSRARFILKPVGENQNLSSGLIMASAEKNKHAIKVRLRVDLEKLPAKNFFGIIQVSIEDKKIISQVEIRFLHDHYYEMDFTQDLFWIQRREHFRLRLPLEFIAKFIISYNSKTYQLKIIDISAGGLLTFISDEMSHSLDSIKQGYGTLLLPGYDKKDFPFEVRQKRKVVGGYEMGLAFRYLSPSDEQELMSLTLDLYRRFYQAK